MENHPPRAKQPGAPIDRPASEMLDNRLSERIPLQLPCTLETETQPAQELITKTHDISGGGLQCVLESQLPPGMHCRLKLELAPGTIIALPCIIVRDEKEPGGWLTAVHFRKSAINAEDFRTYSQFIAAQLLMRHLGELDEIDA